MRWGRTVEQSNALYSQWKPWFAWHPVQLASGIWVWLEWIERKKHSSIGFYDTQTHDHRLPLA